MNYTAPLSGMLIVWKRSSQRTYCILHNIVDIVDIEIRNRALMKNRIHSFLDKDASI